MSETPHAQDLGVFIDKIREFCPEPRVIVDCGAGDGYDAAQLKLAFPSARVIAVEPVNADEIEGVEVIKAAAWDAPGEREFFISSQPGLCSLRNRDVDGIGSRMVPTFRLDSLVTPIDVLKLDCEGTSYEVLLGLGAYIRELKVIHVETETMKYFDGQHLEEGVFFLLKRSGMKMVWECRSQIGDGIQADSIWVRA